MSKIKFVRTYTAYDLAWYDVIYKSGRVVTATMNRIPATVRKYIENANKVTRQYDKTFKRWEIIHEMITCGATGNECTCQPNERGEYPCKTCKHGKAWQSQPILHDDI